MGQKINPIGFRLGVNRTADSRWYADSADFGRLLDRFARVHHAQIFAIFINHPHLGGLDKFIETRPIHLGGRRAERTAWGKRWYNNFSKTWMSAARCIGFVPERKARKHVCARICASVALLRHFSLPSRTAVAAGEWR